MTAALTLAHRQALLTALVRVRDDNVLAPTDRGAITALLLDCVSDPDGERTLDALSTIFEEFDHKPSARAVLDAFAELTNACHALGQASSFSDASAR